MGDGQSRELAGKLRRPPWLATACGVFFMRVVSSL
jgi:hypothetical protein